MASALVRPECVIAGFATSLNKAVDKAAEIRMSCAQTDVIIFLLVAGTVISVFYYLNFPRWSKNLSFIVTGAYIAIWIPLKVMFENASHMAQVESGFSRSEWVNLVTADQRVRFTAIISIAAAFIVSGNAWLARLEAKQRQ